MKIPKPEKLPSGTWRIRMRLGGVSVPVTGRSEREVKRAAELIKAQHRAGKWQAERAKKWPTLTQAIDKYIEERDGVLSPSTIRGYRIIQRSRFKGVMDKHIDQITNWQKIVNDEAKSASPKTVKNAWGFIRSVLAQNNIAADVTTPKTVTNRHAFLQPEQIPMFLAAIKDHPCEMAALLALHSLRRSELLALDKKATACGLIRVSGGLVPDSDNQMQLRAQNKTEASARVIPIFIPRLQDLIDAAPGGRLVTIHPDTLRKNINAICRDANLPEVGIHGLRHTFASLCYSRRLSEMETMRLGGWSDPGTMRKIYTHLSERDKRESEEKLQAFFQNSPTKTPTIF